MVAQPSIPFQLALFLLSCDLLVLSFPFRVSLGTPFLPCRTSLGQNIEGTAASSDIHRLHASLFGIPPQLLGFSCIFLPGLGNPLCLDQTDILLVVVLVCLYHVSSFQPPCELLCELHVVAADARKDRTIPFAPDPIACPIHCGH